MEFTTEMKMHTNNQFGIFRMELGKTEITEAEQEIHLMLDKSGSMDEFCGDGSTKMHQIKHVTNNILRFIAKNCVKGNVAVSVKAFNVDVETVFDKIVVTEDLLDELMKKVEKIYPNDGTDIGLALNSMHSVGVNRHNIFMSDGDANIGETSPLVLAEHVDKNALNTFVGFGLEHNPEIFMALSETKNSAYYFVDKVEKSGNAYGEILHGILYNCLSEVWVRIVGGTLYNWKTNEWTTEIFVGNLAGEIKKTFHIKSETAEQIQITVTGITKDLVPFSTTHLFQGDTEDLQKMIYRQTTQEILFKANRVINEREKIKKIKEELKTFMTELKEYMKTKELENDPLLKNLCDDIVVVYRTIGTRYGQMYSSSRQTSQGNERLHNVCDTPRKAPHRAPHKAPHRDKFRSWTEDDDEEEEEDDTIMDMHILTDGLEDTPYYSGRVATLMRSVTEQDADE
jgi:hypothetical protein